MLDNSVSPMNNLIQTKSAVFSQFSFGRLSSIKFFKSLEKIMLNDKKNEHITCTITAGNEVITITTEARESSIHLHM
jgi:hypothetical protein